VHPFTPAEREHWFHAHSDGMRHRLLVAQIADKKILGYACTGQFRSKQAYDTTVEASVACLAGETSKGLGTLLYAELFRLLACEDVHRIVAGIAQPNAASNRLHEKFGFRQIGIFNEVGRKFGKYWDVRWMEKHMP
jgi:phosphinothricin acetyltransferase